MEKVYREEEPKEDKAASYRKQETWPRTGPAAGPGPSSLGEKYKSRPKVSTGPVGLEGEAEGASALHFQDRRTEVGARKP